jgi:hypothetical protein
MTLFIVAERIRRAKRSIHKIEKGTRARDYASVCRANG